jgi:hypothetical protein
MGEGMQRGPLALSDARRNGMLSWREVRSGGSLWCICRAASCVQRRYEILVMIACRGDRMKALRCKESRLHQ